MRIAFVTTMAGFPWGGSEIAWTRAAETAVEDGHMVLATVFDWSVDQRAVQRMKGKGIEILARPREIRRSLVRRVLKRVGLERATPRWLETLQQFKPDVVCVSSGIHHECLAEPRLFEWLVGERVPFSYIVQCNSERVFLNDAMRDAERKILDAARKVIFVAEGNLELAERQLAHRFSNAMVLINAVERRAEPLPWPAGDPVFAFVARFDVAYKGHDILFRVLSEPRWRERRWTCRLFGEGRDRAYVQELVRFFELESRVEFAGHVPDVTAIWKSSHLCVLPSRAEGTPLALEEAFAAGRPAVVTDVGGNAELAEDEVTGFIAEAATPRSYGAALERAWQARDRWEAMGRAAHVRTLERIDPNPGRTLLELIKATA